MHFKANPWDFDRNRRTIIDPYKPGLYLFTSYDSYLEVFFTRKMKALFKGNPIDGSIHAVHGEDVSLDWFQDTFESPGLFGDNSSYLVLMAETMDKKVLEYVIKNHRFIDDRFLVLSFFNSFDYFKKLEKHEGATLLSLTEPKFWDGDKHFDFICKILKFGPTPQIRRYLMDNLAPDTASLITGISLLKKAYGSPSGLTTEAIDSLISKSNLNKFDLASAYCRKRQDQFMKELLDKNPDFDELGGIFAFMVSHLVKVMDTDAILKKSGGGRLNKYNKEIVSVGKLWKKDELSKSLRKFSNWQKLARSRSPELYGLIKSEYLNLIKT